MKHSTHCTHSDNCLWEQVPLKQRSIRSFPEFIIESSYSSVWKGPQRSFGPPFHGKGSLDDIIQHPLHSLLEFRVSPLLTLEN